MINFIKKQLALRRVRRILKSNTQPDENFLRSTRESFIALARSLAPQRDMVRHFSPHLFRRAVTVMAIVLIFMTTGMAVFAENNDVSATHLLYPLKRFSEQIRLNVSSPVKQVELHEEYAHRRLKEISALDTKKPQNAAALKLESRQISVLSPVASASFLKEKMTNQARIKELRSDFEKEAVKTVEQAKEIPLSKEKRIELCEDLLTQADQRSLNSEDMPLRKLRARCAEVTHDQHDQND